jgi:hypothetical protein
MSRAICVVILAAVVLGGCTYYQVAPGTYVTAPVGKFDQAWSAVAGAFSDQGVQITREDRASGLIRGVRDGIELTANVRTQADGSVRVELNRAGATGDPGLLDRISRAYDRRMGRNGQAPQTPTTDPAELFAGLGHAGSSARASTRGKASDRNGWLVPPSADRISTCQTIST